MEKLKAEAEKLKVKFDENTPEEDLKKAVDTRKKELESDINYWKEQATKWETEAKTAFLKRDQFKGDREKLSTTIKDLQEDMKGMVKSEELTTKTKELEQLQKFKDEFDKEKEAKELENKTEVERLQIEIRKKEESFQKMIDDKMKDIEESRKKDKEAFDKLKEEAKSLRMNGLKAEIVTASAKLNVFNPSQIYSLIRDKFVYDGNLNKYTHQIRNESGKLVDEMSVDEYVKEFLGREENENLVKSKINSDSLNTDKETKGDHKLTSNDYNPKDPEIIRKAELESMTPERYIQKVLIPQKNYRNRGKKE
jgi:hypothetical protein